MKRIVLFIVAAACTTAIGAEEDYLQRSRELTQRFAAQLQGELMRAMIGDGPLAAVEVCVERAPLIAAELSRESGAKLGRTSLKFRNPGNAPEPWQFETLQRFDVLGAEAAPEKLEVFQAEPGPGIEARYMKAIVAKPMCLACHGEPAGELRDLIKAKYPHDLATGYEAGDIRGAFYVTWPERPDEAGAE